MVFFVSRPVISLMLRYFCNNSFFSLGVMLLPALPDSNQRLFNGLFDFIQFMIELIIQFHVAKAFLLPTDSFLLMSTVVRYLRRG